MTLFYMRFISSYWHHYDMGFSGGNGFALVFLHGPVSLLLFLAVIVFGWLLLRWLRIGPWLGIPLIFIAMFLVLAFRMANEVRRTAGYPTDVTTPFGQFFEDFLSKCFS